LAGKQLRGAVSFLMAEKENPAESAAEDECSASPKAVLWLKTEGARADKDIPSIAKQTA
jgi:hypothetical protein